MQGSDLARDPRCVMDSFLRVGFSAGVIKWDPFWGGSNNDVNDIYGNFEGFNLYNSALFGFLMQ